MQTRIIHTKVWEDQWFHKLSKDAKYLWIYLLSNPKVNISGIYELSDDKILYDTSIESYEELEKIKKDLISKAVFFDSWVRILNIERYNKYRNSPKNEVAYQRELTYISEHISKGLGIQADTSIYTPINQKPETLIPKSEIKNKKLDLEENKKKLYKEMNWKQSEE